MTGDQACWSAIMAGSRGENAGLNDTLDGPSNPCRGEPWSWLSDSRIDGRNRE